VTVFHEIRLQREHTKWRSPVLRREMEILAFGHAGEAFLAFPTSGGRHFEWEHRGMPEVLSGPLEEGRIQLFCLDTVNDIGWYNKRRKPPGKIKLQQQYERYLLDEVLPFIRSRNPDGSLATTGTSLGGYHAMNLALRHPHLFGRCISLGGAFSIRRFLGTYFDQGVFEQNPPDYIAALEDPALLDQYRHHLGLVLAVGERDFLLDENRRFSALLHSKGIPHYLDVWGDGAEHDWPWWQRMAAKHF
jgi:esterase/lipase superfamily enzyme